MQHVNFDKNNLFFNELKKKVENYFEVNKIKKTGNLCLYFKALCLTASAISLYITLVFFTPGILTGLILCCLLGITWASIGFNIMHEGAHGSFSHIRWINNLMGYSFNAIGGSVYLWKHKHNVNHHTYTNIEGMDDDIDIRPWIRVHKDQKRYWYHRFQHFYWIPLYFATYWLLIFVQDFRKYVTGKVGTTPFRKMDIREHFIFWISKLLYIAVFIVLPIIKIGFLKAFIGYTVASFVCGFVIAVIFQLAHVVENLEFSAPNSKHYKIENEWAVHQIMTTANFATKSKFFSWYAGGLNFQVEHHLFPRISHIHYPNINKLVRESCDKFGISYSEFPTIMNAIRSHVAHLKQAGQA